ncbi:MAG TPA: PEP-utilizing enzyme, partial [Herpetosiphonaceae bacterium]|nr:PEP-utilizing enzyme [Herpetosiphonaceae bacterium]
PGLLAEAAGRLYLDATPALRNPIGRRLIQLPFRAVDPTTAYAFPELLKDPRLAVRPVSRRVVAKVLLGLLHRSWPLPLRIVEAFHHPAQARREAETAVAERVARIDQISRRHMLLEEQTQMVRVLLFGGLSSIPTRLPPLVAAGILSSFVTEALARRWGLDVSKVVAVRQGLAGNPTTEMDLALWNLSQQIKANPDAWRAFAEESPEAVGAAYRAGTLPEPIQAAMAAFFERYGHRGIREIDGGMPRWSDAPEYIIGMIRNYLLLDDPALAPDRHFAELARTAEQARGELIAAARAQRQGWLKGAVIGFLTSRMRVLMGAREAPKFWVVRILSIVRRILRGAGEELVRREQLDHADDVFFLRLDELGAQTPDLKSMVARRRAAYTRELERRQLPRILTSDGTIITGRRPVGSPTTLEGIGVSPGEREGHVRVIRDPHGAHLAPGEILVAPSTDPAWTPLFLTAGGLVMEAGGLLSHGSVVAREYGIPAVVGVADATARLTTGQRVRIDGAAGTVELLPDAPASAVEGD